MCIRDSYKGTPQGLTDVVGGQVDFMFTDLASGLPFVQSGQLRALAVSTAERSAIVPDLPSMADVYKRQLWSLALFVILLIMALPAALGRGRAA